jgi:hypothetical protein
MLDSIFNMWQSPKQVTSSTSGYVGEEGLSTVNLFFITYDLVKPGKDYQKLWDKLKNLGCQRVLLSVWAVRGNYTAADLRDVLKDFIDANDRLLVVQSADWATWAAMISPNKI